MGYFIDSNKNIWTSCKNWNTTKHRNNKKVS